MPFAPGTPKPQNSGRKKGITNKICASARDKLESMGCDPIQGMATIALDAKNPIELRARMFIELAQYCFPKLKAIQHFGTGAEGAIQHEHSMSAAELLASKLAQLAERQQQEA